MARRARIVTREDLLHRYATAGGYTYGEAHDLHARTSVEVLRDLVEILEADITEGLGITERRSFASSQPTTSLQGQTR